MSRRNQVRRTDEHVGWAIHGALGRPEPVLERGRAICGLGEDANCKPRFEGNKWVHEWKATAGRKAEEEGFSWRSRRRRETDRLLVHMLCPCPLNFDRDVDGLQMPTADCGPPVRSGSSRKRSGRFATVPEHSVRCKQNPLSPRWCSASRGSRVCTQ